MKVYNETTSAILDIAGTAVLTTDAIELEHMAGYSIHAKWVKIGGVLAGTCKTFKSNDKSYWIEVTSQNIIDASGNKEFEVPDVFYKYVRTVTTLTGGSATVTIIANAKGV